MNDLVIMSNKSNYEKNNLCTVAITKGLLRTDQFLHI